MKLKKESWHGLLYYSTYHKDMPNNLCKYFWKLILAIILFIPTIFGHIWNFYKYFKYKRKNDDGIYNMSHPATYWLYHILIAFILGAASTEKTGKNFITVRTNKLIGFWDVYLNGMLILLVTLLFVAIVAAILILIRFIFINLNELYNNWKYSKEMEKFRLNYTGKPNDFDKNFVYYINNKRNIKFDKKWNRKYILVEYIKGFMGKYCPKITWTEE